MWGEANEQNYNSSDVDEEDLLNLGDSSSVEDNDNAHTTSFDGNDALQAGRSGNAGSQGLLGRPRAQRRASVGGKWTAEEDALLKDIVELNGAKSWKKVASLLGKTRTDVQCLHRWNKVLRPGLQKGSWSKEEDHIVKSMVMDMGVAKVKWSYVAEHLPGRIGKQCRERWFNHLDPSIKKGDWARDEDVIIFEAQRHFGNRWCEISKLLPGRTENAVKNRWNSCAMKKWMKEKQLQEGDRAVPIVSSASSTTLPAAGVDGDKKRGRGAAAASSTKNPADDRERLLASLESFRRCLMSAGVALFPDAASSLEGIMIGESHFGGMAAPHWTTEDVGRAGFGSSAGMDSLATSRSTFPSSSSGSYPYRINTSGAGSGPTTTTARGGVDGDGAAMAHDECAHQLVEMLHLLKKTPATDSVSRDRVGSGGRAIGGTASVSGSVEPSEDSSDGQLGDDDSGADEAEDPSPLGAGTFGRSGGYGTRKRSAAEMEREQNNSLASHLQKMQDLRNNKKKGTSPHEPSSSSSGNSSSATRTSAPFSAAPAVTTAPIYRPLGLMEPQKLRQQEERQPQLDAPPPQLTMQAPTNVPGKVGAFDPTCPVSVAMAKLRALIGDSPEVNSAELPAHAQPVAVPSSSSSGSGSGGSAALRASTGGNQGMGALAELVAGGAAEGGESEEDVEEEEVPLECLRFFKLLNRRARRSLIKQLISQLQRTACTPREGLGGMGDGTPRTLDPATPSATMGYMQEILQGYGSHGGEGELLDPNCFEMAEQEDAGSHIARSQSSAPTSSVHTGLRAEAEAAVEKIAGGGGGIQFPEHLHLMPPPSVFPLSRRSPMHQRGTGRTQGPAGLSGPAAGGFGAHRVSLSAEDEAAVEAAVEIGYLLSQYSQVEADLLLQTLHREGNLNIYGTSSSTPRTDGRLSLLHGR